ncbi:extracellular solute-binding protein [Deltaproteobacteria bacterium]|nr:extracellular solute-binding protein [Deltaproteobacteria bacterium]
MRLRLLYRFGLFILCVAFLAGCSKNEEDTPMPEEELETLKLDYSYHKLPDGIEWLTNDSDPVTGSPDAKKGGSLNSAILSFPLTFRTVGPDANTGSRSLFSDNMMLLVGLHPNTKRLIPVLASHWAYSEDGKTMYFKLHENAEWSDGVPVTADDFIFALELMRSEHIKDPWHNDNFTKHFDEIIKYDDRTFSISSPEPYPDLWFHLEMQPRPKHFYKGIDKNFVSKYNWVIEPNTGPYILSEFKKGKYLIFKRKKDWWAKDLRYYQYRYNVDEIKYTVIRDINVIFEHFKKGDIDVFGATRPDIWHVKATGEIFDKGYVHKIWFYNDVKQPTTGFFLNLDKEIFQDINLRYALAHAINFEKLNRQVLRGDYQRLHNIDTGYREWTNGNISARKFDIKKVEEYMKKSGWQRGADGIWEKNGQRYSVSVTYGVSEHTPRLVVLKEEAKKAGIELRLELLDPSSSYKKEMEKKHEIAYTGFTSPNLRPTPWQSFHSDNAHKPQTNNITNTDDPELDRLIDAYRDSQSTEEQIKLIHEIQQKIHDICSWIPLYQVPYIRSLYWRWINLPEIPGTRSSTSLFEPNEPWDSKYGGYFWINEDVKKETLEAMKSGKGFEPVTIIDETFKIN